MEDAFDFGMAASTALHKEVEKQEIRRQLLVNLCGDCALWMSGGCPKERNVNGTQVGPSMNDPVCRSFLMSPFAQRRKLDAQKRLDELTSGK